MKHTSRIFTVFLSALLMLCLFGAPLSADLLKIDNTAPAGFSETTNPYGYKAGDPFPLVIKNEVAFYGGSGGGTELGLKDTNSRDDLNTLIREPSDKTGDTDYGRLDSVYCYVQAIALDGDGDGKKNHVAFVGFNNKTYHAEAWLIDMDSTDKNPKDVVDLGPMTWLSDGNYEQYSSTSLFSITAGDYDGNGKETVVIAVPLDYNNTTAYGSRLFELAVDTHYNKLYERTWSTKHLGDDLYRNETDMSNSLDTSRNKLGISLATGDFNGDCTDDLAVLTYRHKMYNTNVNEEYYDTELTIVYRTNSNSSYNVIDSPYYQKFHLTSEKDGEISFPVAATLTVGNWNNDDFDDLAVVGVKAWATLNGWNINGQITVEGSTWYIQNIYGGKDDDFRVVEREYVGSNEWFEDGFYTDDNCYGRVMAEGFALNGETNPDYLFISGSLFEMSTGKPVYVGQNDYFSSEDVGLNENFSSNLFMQSTTVGNFIGDPAGREQVLYTIGMKHRGKNKYYYKCGYVGGKDFQDSDTAYGVAGGYYFSDVNDDSDYIYEDKDDNLSSGLNCSLIAVDYGNDSVYAKYLSKQYAYSDPSVSMVLQAAPYFSEVGGPGSNWTEYKLTTIYGSGRSGSKELEPSLGMSGSGGIPGIVNLSVTLEYTCSRTEAWEKSQTTTNSQSFVATAYDTVVVNRIPVFIYQYDVMDENGNWYGGPKMELMAPQPAVYESLSVDDYNDFAKTYNDQMATVDDDFDRLETIDKAENYLDQNEGNPYAYNIYGWNGDSINATQISTSPVALGTNGALGRIEWTEENTRTDSWETTKGFDFSFCSRFGPESFGMGPSGSMHYEEGYGNTTTSGTAIGAACTVQDIDGPGLAAQGISSDVIKSFGFDWTFGRWERHLCGDKDNKTPFIGYALSNITSAPLSVKDLTASANSADSIKLSWSKPTEKGAWPNIIGYDIYQKNDNGTYTKVGSRAAANATSATVSGLDPLTEYTFVLVSVAKVDNYEMNSVWSNEATARTTTKQYTYTVNDFDEKAATVTAKTYRGETVTNGQAIYAGQIITVTAEAKDSNSSVLSITVNNGKGTYTFASNDNNRTATAKFLVSGNTTVTVNTERTVTSSNVTFKDSYEGGKVAATVYGANLAAPGGVVSAPVTFTATPNSGYYLKAWTITADGTTKTFDAANMNPFTLELKHDSYKVEAVFEKAAESTVVITVEQPAEGGTIELTDASGKAIVLNEKNSATVNYGAKITATAKPLTGYVFSAWTGDAAQYTTQSFTTEVKSNMTFGATLVAPIKYSLSYGVNDDTMGDIAMDPPVPNNSLIAAGTKMNAVIKAADGYVISEITLTIGTETQTIPYTPADAKTTAIVDFTMNSNVSVNATFIPCVCASYSDLSVENWYHRPVAYAISNELMHGYSATEFAPQDNASRAQVVTILHRLAGSPAPKEKASFEDIPANAWYADAVAWAKEMGIAKGMTATHFAPEAYVNREQLVTFIHRYAKLNDMVHRDGVDLSRYKDGDDVSEFAKISMAWALREHIIIGMGNRELAPQGNSTRAQMATMLMRLDKLSQK
ncbi:MAG: S-layer homology domain-containing protein [Firmicutes bacterium]|nr:S-layer homology domain-containing protein [Bacillota bacterium]